MLQGVLSKFWNSQY